MSAVDYSPVVVEEDGTPIGIDWRRIPSMGRPEVQVPGVIEARWLCPGDTVNLGAGEVLVLTRRRHGRPNTVYVTTRTVGGAEIVHELRDSERVRVVAAGAFDEAVAR